MPKTHNEITGGETIENAQRLLAEALVLYNTEKYTESIKNLSAAHKIFLAFKDIAKVSVCLSLTGLMKYLSKEENYYKSLLLIEDSKFLAESTMNKSVIAVNKFAFGQIYFNENKYNEALFYLAAAADDMEDFPLIRIKAYTFLALTYIRLKNKKMAYDFLEIAFRYAETSSLKQECDNIRKISDSILHTKIDLTKTNKKKEIEASNSLLASLAKVARAVNTESSLEELLLTIAEETRIVLNADRCSVFLYDKEKNELWSKVAQGVEKGEIRFSADKGFAGYVVKTGETVRIKDVYQDSRFNKEIDAYTGYKTYNLLCMPMRNIKFEIIGVFQVLNKKDGDFTDYDEEILLAIGTNAGIAIENNMLLNIQQKMIQDQKRLFTGFIDTLSASIDARDKITLGHSNRVKLYSELISQKLGLNKDFTEIISKAAMLHDIGKIGIRDAVLQKKGTLTKEEYEHIKDHVRITYDILCRTSMNSAFAEITEIAASHHEKYDGTGYFRGLKGEDIPFGGRILAVSDVFDAITSDRHYRDRMPMKDVFNIIIGGKDKHFDGKIVDAFLDIPCDIIMDVLINEYGIKLEDQDRKVLSKIKLIDFANILQKDNPNKTEQKIIEVFNLYYNRRSDKNNGI